MTATTSYRVLFDVPFHTAMTDDDLHRLNRGLGMATALQLKTLASQPAAGVARLDFWSGLFLTHDADGDRWRLQARTWATPAPQSVHAWHPIASDAARLLDPAVPVPPRLDHDKGPHAST